MTKQEKLISLENTVLSSAIIRADEIVVESEEKKAKAIENFKISLKAKSEKEYLAKVHKAETDMTVDVSKASFAARQEVLKRRGELTRAVYAAAEKQILDFCESGEYADMLAAKMSEHSAKISQGDLLLLCQRDANNPAIKSEAEGIGLEIATDKTILLGGFRLKLFSAGIMIDETFDSKLSQIKLGEKI
jgi:Archaeal/vacuolar-type H+-ATPase subunit E